MIEVKIKLPPKGFSCDLNYKRDLDAFLKPYLLTVLQRFNGNKKRAAREIGMCRNTLKNHLVRMGIEK